MPTTSPGADAPPRPGRRRRRLPSWRTALGLTLVLGGLSVLGWVAWQYYGTDYVSRRAQAALVQDTEAAWEAQAAEVPGRSAEEPLDVPAAADALVRIPRFGDDYVMPVQSGTDDAVLAEGFGHFDGSADPGARGNYALAAHRVTHGEPLRDMPRLRPGDEVVVTTRDAEHVYELDTDPFVVSFEDLWVVDPLPDNPDGGPEPPVDAGDRLITLTTCAELFHTDTRMIAFGHLVSTTPR